MADKDTDTAPAVMEDAADAASTTDAAAVEVLKCSRCEKTRDTTGSPQWCKACRAQYKREYDLTIKTMTESRGYAAGCSAMRAFLAAKFEAYGMAGSFTGEEIAALIRQAKDSDVSAGVARRS